MTTAFDNTDGHPVTSTIAAVRQQLRDVVDLRLWTLGSAETDANLVALAALRHQIAELRHAHHADRLDLGTEAGATDTGSHWAHQTRQTTRDAKKRLALAVALDRDHEPVRQAMAAGGVSEEQAAVIVKGVDALPVEHRRAAEDHLVGLAGEHDPVALRPARGPGPGGGRPRHRRGTRTQGVGAAAPPSPVGAILKEAVLAMNAPKHRHHSGTPKGLGHAFCETSPATPSTGSRKPEGWTPRWWSR